jgi:hypothetical protein
MALDAACERFITDNMERMSTHDLCDVKVRTSVLGPEIFFLISARVQTEDAGRFWDHVLTEMESQGVNAGVGDGASWRLIGKMRGWESFKTG